MCLHVKVSHRKVQNRNSMWVFHLMANIHYMFIYLALSDREFVKWMPSVWKQPSYWWLFKLYIIWKVPKPLTQRYFSIKCHALCLNSHYLASTLQSAWGQIQNLMWESLTQQRVTSGYNSENGFISSLWESESTSMKWTRIKEKVSLVKKATECPEVEHCGGNEGPWEGSGPGADCCSLPAGKQTDALQQGGWCRTEDQELQPWVYCWNSAPFL